jgi:hypothetical protein
MSRTGRSAGWQSLAWGIGASIVAFGALLTLSFAADNPVTYAVADHQQFTGSRFIGLTTTAGLLVWAAALAVCLFPLSASAPADRAFFWASAGVTLMLLVDDWLLIHEYFGGLPDVEASSHAGDFLEAAVLAAFAAVFALYARRHWDRLTTAGGRIFLGAALALFVASSAVDFHKLLFELDVASDLFTFAILAEEGLKFAGIVFWLLFYWSVASESLTKAPAEST